jgi:hypothetical protein
MRLWNEVHPFIGCHRFVVVNKDASHGFGEFGTCRICHSLLFMIDEWPGGYYVCTKGNHHYLPHYDRPKESYTINANSLGVFQFIFVKWEVHGVFENQGYVSRKIQFDTQNVPDKSWRRVRLVLECKWINVRGFHDMVAELPFATFSLWYWWTNFLFDLEETNVFWSVTMKDRAKAWQVIKKRRNFEDFSLSTFDNLVGFCCPSRCGGEYHFLMLKQSLKRDGFLLYF